MLKWIKALLRDRDKKVLWGYILKKILLFFLMSICIFTKEFTKEERIHAIDKEIEEIMKKKGQLELLKKKIIETDKKKFPKIALVLSGGGTKGFAHIGVLKVLEKNKIPIDMIVGTSAGSIIGGMYSIGYSAEEIERIVLKMDFLSVMLNGDERSFLNIEEKVDSEKYPLKINISKNLTPSIPMGLLNGEGIYLKLKEIFNPSEGVQNFNNFPIPFRAITTNLNTGEEVIIDSGDLALATFKSMAIPSLIEPVQGKNGDYYVDGGVTNNMGVDVAILAGADIIIAVDVSAPADKIEEKSNVIAVLDKLSTYQGTKNFEFQTQIPNILIIPNIKNRGTIEFSDLASLIVEGEKAAEKYNYYFEKLSNSKKFNVIQEKKLKSSSFKIDRINLVGNSILTKNKVESLIPKCKNNLYTYEDIVTWTKKIYALPYVNRVFYDIDGETITFSVKEKASASVGIGLNYFSDYGASINIETSIPYFGLWNRNYMLTTEISKYPKIHLNTFSFYEMKKMNIMGSFNIGYESTPYFIYDKNDRVATYRGELLSADMSLGTTFLNNIILGGTVGYEHFNSKYSEGNKAYSEFNFNGKYGYAKTFIYLDTLDNKAFPSKGMFLFAETFSGKSVGKNGEYYGYLLNTSINVPVLQNLSFSIGGSLGKIGGTNILPKNLFKLGGIRETKMSNSFAGLPLMGKYADNFYIAEVGLKYRVTSSFYIMGKYNMLTYEDNVLSFSNGAKLWKDIYKGYGGGIGWDAFIGPISFTVSNNINGGGPIYEFYLGYTF